MIILNNHFQVVPTALEDARTVVLLDVGQHVLVIVEIIVSANVKQVVRTIVLLHAKVGVKVNVLLLALPCVKKTAFMSVKPHVKDAKTHAWVHAQLDALILALHIARDVAGRLIN
ncbi:MAG: hypothetical protein IJP44_13390 [Bacteroidales bacterium]|nr:hypothetical protein [Bacteroidales bacterium]